MLVQVAISMLMLMGFAVFVVDYGVVWVVSDRHRTPRMLAPSRAASRRFDDVTTPPAGRNGLDRGHR